MRDVRLYDFYPLVQPWSFGQSIQEKDSVGPFGWSPFKGSLFSTTTSSTAHAERVDGSVHSRLLPKGIVIRVHG
jgi:hypothetical protein